MNGRRKRRLDRAARNRAAHEARQLVTPAAAAPAAPAPVVVPRGFANPSINLDAPVRPLKTPMRERRGKAPSKKAARKRARK